MRPFEKDVEVRDSPADPGEASHLEFYGHRETNFANNQRQPGCGSFSNQASDNKVDALIAV